MTIVKGAGNVYRLYSGKGKVIGTFTNLRDAQEREQARIAYLKSRYGKKGRTDSRRSVKDTKGGKT